MEHAAEQALLTLAQVMTGLSQRAADRLDGTSLGQLRVLTVLAGADPVSVPRLGEHLGVTAAATSRVVDRIVAAGLARRATARDGPGGLQLTDAGRQLLEEYDRHRMNELRTAVAVLPEPAQRGLLDALPALGALARELGGEERPALPPPVG